MPKIPQGQQGQPDNRVAVVARIPQSLDREIEIACAAMGWKKQHFLELAARNLLAKLAGGRQRGSR
jgi:hypothetical protein